MRRGNIPFLRFKGLKSFNLISRCSKMSILNGQELLQVCDDIMRFRHIKNEMCLRLIFLSWLPASIMLTILIGGCMRMTCLLIISRCSKKRSRLGSVKVIWPSNKGRHFTFTWLLLKISIKLMSSFLYHCFVPTWEILKNFPPLIWMTLVKHKEFFIFKGAKLFRLRKLCL